MGEFNFSIEKITGAASATCACGIFNKKISLADGSFGTLVGCVLIRSENDDAPSALRDMFDLVVSKLEGMEDSILENMEMARHISGEFVAGRQLVVSFVHAFFYEDVCYVVRANDKVKVQVFDWSKSAQLSFESGSGPVGAGQIYLLATEKFLSIFDTAVLGQGDEVDLVEVIDGLATEISAEKDQSEIGAVFVQVRGESRETERPASVEPDSTSDGGQRDEETGGIERVIANILSILAVLPRKILVVIVREFKRLRGGEAGARGRLRRNLVILALVVLLVLAGSGVYTLKKNQEKKKLLEFEMHLTAASSRLAEGAAIVELNTERAREILIDADGEVKAALAIDSGNARAKSLETDIGSKLKEMEVSANINFGTVVQVEGVNSLSLSGKSLVAVGANAVFEIDPAGKSAEKISEQTGALGSFVYDNKAFLLTDTKVFRVDIASGESRDLFDQSGAHDIGVFFGNVYLLRAGKIDKYVPVEAGYSGPSDYLVESSQFGNRSRFAIDGLIWVADGNKVFKFNRGEKQDFEIWGLAGGAGELGIIYTSTSLDNLYIVDVTNSALLVVGRDGIYKKAYQSPEFGKASDLVVSDDESKVYITVGNKVLEAGL